MNRCRETAGVLFKHACKEHANQRCGRCQKPICERHARAVESGPLCVTCLREDVAAQEDRGSVAWLREDPYFYWYHSSYQWGHSHYTRDDYRLFDSSHQPSDVDADLDAGWEGS